ncbi:hypothetical protein Acr_06g0008450 [Actinidia rufa]|uniref:Uncharacterized protein n=1 Tax=Actinidia rufa TaxID=165716 RepID=A0A7J0EQZ6_9ERIC|nr:hypothetical protein Acr_06g0008450 [Actinidia rufa]
MEVLHATTRTGEDPRAATHPELAATPSHASREAAMRRHAPGGGSYALHMRPHERPLAMEVQVLEPCVCTRGGRKAMHLLRCHARTMLALTVDH